jgi:hypothetical protein
MRLIWNILVNVLLCAGAFPASGPVQPFSVTLDAPSAAVKIGSEVRIKATITNTSDHEIRFARSLGLRDEEFECEIEVRDARGQIPALTPAFRHQKENPTSRWGSYMTYVLEPGKSFHDDLTISHVYTLEAEEYTIWVARGTRPLWQNPKQETAKSNTIKLTVTN